MQLPLFPFMRLSWGFYDSLLIKLWIGGTVDVAPPILWADRIGIFIKREMYS